MAARLTMTSKERSGRTRSITNRFELALFLPFRFELYGLHPMFCPSVHTVSVLYRGVALVIRSLSICLNAITRSRAQDLLGLQPPATGDLDP